MPADVFGDLRDWGDVLKKLAQLRADGALDEHQSGLARLIRCRDNWRLQEEALISAAEVTAPCAALVDATLTLLKDKEEILENRLLAAHALGTMLSASSAPDSTGEVPAGDVVDSMRELLTNGGPPVLQRAVWHACELVAPLS